LFSTNPDGSLARKSGDACLKRDFSIESIGSSTNKRFAAGETKTVLFLRMRYAGNSKASRGRLPTPFADTVFRGVIERDRLTKLKI
jgi:hypothetical protein